MSYKKWTVSLLCIVLAIVFLFGVSMFILDPLVRYRSEEEGVLSYYEHSELYTNPGIAMNYSYDAVLVGTSMVQNTDILECNELLDCNMVKLTYSGGTAHNMKIILDLCFASDNDISLIYWELDEFQLFSNSGETRYSLPEYMYKQSHFRDLEYLLSIDIMYHYGLKPLYYTLRGYSQSALSTGDMWSDTDSFGYEIVMSSYTAPEKQAEKPEDHYSEVVLDNLNTNILPLIEQNPDTEFVFFFAPFSILYWYNELQNGTFDANVKADEDAISILLEYDNVSVFYFRNETDITTDLEYYKDYSHYNKEINSYITQCIANDQCRLTLENYRDEIEEFADFTKNFDFTQLFQNN